MKIACIYKATNKINGMSYIGHDSTWPRRQIEHKSSALTFDSQTYFHRAIRKYGWDNFEWEVIHQSLDAPYLSSVMEPHFIKYYDTLIPNGYNMTLGGDGVFGRIVTEETRKKHRLNNMGKQLTKQNKLDITLGLMRMNEEKSPRRVKVWTIYGPVIFGTLSQTAKSMKTSSDLIKKYAGKKTYCKHPVITAVEYV
jgi:hypothetical protein